MKELTDLIRNFAKIDSEKSIFHLHKFEANLANRRLKNTHLIMNFGTRNVIE